MKTVILAILSLTIVSSVSADEKHREHDKKGVPTNFSYFVDPYQNERPGVYVYPYGPSSGHENHYEHGQGYHKHSLFWPFLESTSPTKPTVNIYIDNSRGR